jgi:DNA-binding transcriptional regulator YdaS (Cro superfamily)
MGVDFYTTKVVFYRLSPEAIMSSTLKALERAVEILGGQSAMAAACGNAVKQQHVWNWLNRDKKLPVRYALVVERATAAKGQTITAAELCPDVFGAAA